MLLALGDGNYYQEGNAGETVTIWLGIEEFDTYLIVYAPNGQVIGENDDAFDDNLHSQLVITLPETGI